MNSVTGVEHVPPVAVAIGPLLVTQVTLEAPGVISIRLDAPHGTELPVWEPGAHLDVELPSGLVRQYSLCGDPTDRASYRIAVLHAEHGRGGSEELHTTVLLGRQLTVIAVRNHFALKPSGSTLLIGGGIGITPLLPMVGQLAREGADWKLAYLGRERWTMPFLQEIVGHGDRVVVHPSRELGRLDVAMMVDATDPGTSVYCCGPEALMSAVKEACDRATPPRPFTMERFEAGSVAGGREHAAEAEEQPFTVTLRRSKVELPVPATRSILDVVRDVIPGAPSSCEEGYCGSCETRVLRGVPDHRDSILSPDEQEANDTMFICVSRSRTPNLELDL